MPKKRKHHQPEPTTPARPVQTPIPHAKDDEHVESFWSSNLLTWLIGIGAFLLLSVGLVAAFRTLEERKAKSPSNNTIAAGGSTSATTATPAGTNFGTVEVAQALMVTADLDFGIQIPSIAEALKQIERRSEPLDGKGRTFAVLDAYGEPTPEGKLHISMHVSTEKPGKGALVFKRTGAVLWEGRIVPGTNKVSNFSGKNLLILVDNGQGKLWTVDGSSNPTTVLDANIKEAGIPLRDLWLDQTEREVTFIYSACGCPVKVQTRRDGEKTLRTKDQPVIFPDDPAVVTIIEKVMGW